MNRLLLRLFSLIGLLFIVPLALMAVTPAVHIAPKPAWIGMPKPYDQKPNLRTVESGYYYALFEKQINVEKQATYTHIVKEIVSGTGVQNASEISVSFNPAYETLTFHDITVWRNNKPESRLKVSAFKMLADEDEFSRFIYNGTFAAKYILDDIRKGDRIEYSYTVSGSNPIFYNKFCRTIYLNDYFPSEHRYTSVLFATSRKLNMKNFNKVPAPTVTDVAGGLKRYAWEEFKVKAVEDAKYEPTWYSEFARVQLSDYASWAEVIDWGLKLNPIATNIKGDLGKKISEFKKQADGDQELYFRSAVNFVQNEIRYMGVETGEYSHRANRPEKVFAQRYGDCKDKSLLLASMLEADSIEAEMALISTDLQEKIDDYLPSNGLFDHAIVVATINKKQVWIDPTISSQGGDRTDLYIPPYYRGLILKAGNGKLSVIAPTDPGKIRCEENFAIPNQKDAVTFTVTTIYTYSQADDIRSRLASASMAETEKNYLDYYTKTYPKITATDSVRVIDDIKNNELTTIEHYKIKDFFKQDTITGKYEAGFYASFINEQITTPGGAIKTPVATNYPYHMEYTIKVELPGGWNVDNSHYNIDRDAYKFNQTTIAEGDTLTLYYSLNYLKPYIPVNKLVEFKADMKEITDNHLEYNFSYRPQISDEGTSKINAWTSIMAILVLFSCIFFSAKLYVTRTRSLRLAGHEYGRPIGGWLLLIILGLVSTAILNLYTLFSGNYFNAYLWQSFSGAKMYFFRSVLLFEVFGVIVAICYTMFCLVLLLNRRDIFPKAMIGLYIFFVAYYFTDDVCGLFLNGHVSENGITNFVRALVIACIWISYFRISTRVKETFITPYPPNNIIYEQDESLYTLE